MVSRAFDFARFRSYEKTVIEITSSAASHLLSLLKEKDIAPDAGGLRLSVEKGGCAGLQYNMAIGMPEAADERIEKDGATVFVDAESASFLDGCTIDYTDGLTGSGFRIVNPKAVRSCGCGTSFEPSDT
jgi:iron-sulfur cluster assembly protein